MSSINKKESFSFECDQVQVKA